MTAHAHIDVFRVGDQVTWTPRHWDGRLLHNGVVVHGQFSWPARVTTAHVYTGLDGERHERYTVQRDPAGDGSYRDCHWAACADEISRAAGVSDNTIR